MNHYDGAIVGCIRVGVYGVYCGVPKKAQKGPLKQKIFFFIVATKMIGMPLNLKWKFRNDITTTM